MAAAAEPNNLHFVLFPLMAQGHMIPMVDIARILANHGATVTIFTTPLLANQLNCMITRATESNLKIRLLELQLPLAEAGLPEGFEIFDKVPPSDAKVKFFKAMNLLEQPAEIRLRSLSPYPSCIISDLPFFWTTDVARRLNIPRIVFHGPGCLYILSRHILSTTNVLEQIGSDVEPFVLLGLPDLFEVTKRKLLGTTKTLSDEEKALRERFQEAEKASYGIVVNSFNELEQEYVKELEKVRETKIWCIGPVSLCNKDNVRDIAERGNKGAINENECLKWLDEQETGSVVYVCLGSLAHVSCEQAIEVGLGLESMNRPFIWCVRNKDEKLEKWFSEQGFEERVRDKGLIVHGWAPQVLILSHRATGGFITHCGWNSTLECVSAGVPMGTWPHFADQFLNETFIVEILKVGVRIGVEVPEDVEDKTKVLVSKEDVKTVVERLMSDGEDGKQRRKRVIELAKMAKSAMDEGGSSYNNVLSMIQDITTYHAIKNR
ncbi:UDP-glycosyltransferase 73E1-like [Rutidosis leptorrhynchoides]|uniref:UDP-glycosyltransferase 73E1-like n=1 Tax=Rutidosis leptorrhynchoides TaxID=125765 RepID=UPI003A99E624